MRKLRFWKFFSNYVTLSSAITVIGLFATTFITSYVYRSLQNEDRIRFEYEAEEIVRRIQYRMDTYLGALLQTRAFVLSSERITREEFSSYMENSNLMRRFPGILGIGMKKGYGPVVFMEPMNPFNQTVIGKNFQDDPHHFEAMKRAAETGLPALTKKVLFENRPSHVFYVPYFRQNVPLDTPENRNKNLIGFIYAPFESQFLFNSIFNHHALELEIKIYDEDLIFSTDHAGTALQKNGLHIQKELEIGGRLFRIDFSPSRMFIRKFSLTLLVSIALCGILLTVIMTRLFWFIGKQVDISRKSAKALTQALEARDEFLSIASHELKTPITSLKLQAQMIKRSLEKADGKLTSFEKISALADQTDRQADRLARLVNDMVDISRMRTGKLGIEKERFDLCDLVKDVLERMKNEFVPEVTYCDEAVGHWDKGRIEEVIINLFTNAIKYGKQKPIEILICSNPTFVTLEVKDHGIGIAPEYREKIFERFERAGVSASEVSGLGLGLYITKQIVQLHNGEIWVESEKGIGSTFKVRLPRET